MSISSGTGAVGGLSVRYAYDASKRVLMEKMMLSTNDRSKHVRMACFSIVLYMEGKPWKRRVAL